MPSSPLARTYLTFVALEGCLVGAGACLGFVFGSWWGAGLGAGLAGLGTEAVLVFYRQRVLSSLLEAEQPVVWVGRGAEEGITDAVVAAVCVYEASVFPLIPGGISAEERQARRTNVYRLAAYEKLPRGVRVSAAAALEAIDEGQDAERARAAVQDLGLAAYDARTQRRLQPPPP
ncbi:hypothetical protein ACIP29_36860 [Streptomyces coelicoflavus]|uniref:hypothetical protein n=1 Tax=Streptomyces coelicoflavus TaxID=285562 RepID=UPI0037F94E2C